MATKVRSLAEACCDPMVLRSTRSLLSTDRVYYSRETTIPWTHLITNESRGGLELASLAY